MTTHTPSEDEYEAWRADYVTAWVLDGVRRYAELQREGWAAECWTRGVADQQALDVYRTRADAYAGLADLTYENACGLHEQAKAE